MKITFPHMGYLWIPLKAMLEYLGVDVQEPPPSTKRTMILGTKHAPEFACMPLKLNLGNFMEAAELGADTILMAGGCGPCRFGYYAQVEYAILKDLGYDYELIVIEPPQRHVSEFLAKIRRLTGHRPWWQVARGIRFGYLKSKLVDGLEKKAHWLRPRELVPGATEKALDAALDLIAGVTGPGEIPEMEARALSIMEKVAVDEGRPVVRIGIVGEIYTLLEPFANHDLERHLGRLGVEVDRSIYLSEWINDHLFMGLLKGKRSSKDARRAAVPFLNHFVGGHGQESIGNTVLYAQKAYDGVIQVLPFTCMPEIVAQSILPEVSNVKGIPVLTLIVDEQSGAAGILTRLEAFIDLLNRNKEKKEVLA